MTTEPAVWGVNPTTGEIPDEVTDRARQLASLLEDIAELEAPLKALKKELEVLDGWFRGQGFAKGDRAYAGQHNGKARYIVMVPPKRRRPRSVNKDAADRYSEELMSYGLGRQGYIPPTLAKLEEKLPELIAAGLPVAQIITDPGEGIGELKVVEV